MPFSFSHDAVDLDFVVVATPTASHTGTVTLAIEKGLHVFVEKPFALDAEEGQRVLALLKGNSLVNQVGYVLRFNDVFLQVKQLLDNDVLGELLSFKAVSYTHLTLPTN